MAKGKNTKSTQRRVVGYVRISRDRESETSTDTQQAAIRSYCELRGWQLVQMIVEPGRSAFKASRRSRPGMRDAMSLIATGAADAFVVWKIDRVARNTLDLLTLVKDLDAHGAEFASVTEQFDTTTPMGQAMMTIIGTLAQLESAQKAERALEWHRHRRTTAAVPAGPPVLGYRKPGPNRLELDPVEAPIVRQAVARMLDGGSINSTVKALNAAGVKITNPGLRAALRSPTIAGMVAVNDVLPRRGGARVVDDAELVAGEWEPLLDLATWQRVQAVLDDPRRRVSSNHNQLAHPLIPIIRCHCGSRMRVHNDRRKYQTRRYLCLAPGCLNGIGQDAVDEAVTAAVLDALDPDAWQRTRTQTRQDPVDTAVIDDKLARMWEMVLDGTIEPEEYREAKLRWQGEVAVAASESADLPDVEDVRAAWPDLTVAERNLVFRAAIRSLVIKPARRRGGRGVDLERVDLDLV